jgi:hypothetical protein
MAGKEGSTKQTTPEFNDLAQHAIDTYNPKKIS